MKILAPHSFQFWKWQRVTQTKKVAWVCWKNYYHILFDSENDKKLAQIKNWLNVIKKFITIFFLILKITKINADKKKWLNLNEIFLPHYFWFLKWQRVTRMKKFVWIKNEWMNKEFITRFLLNLKLTKKNPEKKTALIWMKNILP